MPHERPTALAPASTPAGASPRVAKASILAIGLQPSALNRLPRHIVAPNSTVLRLTHPTNLRRRHVTGARAPGLVISPLETGYFDAIDLIRRLSRLGYRGRYLALAGSEPDIALIRREVQSHAPRLNFDVVAMDGRSALHAV